MRSRLVGLGLTAFLALSACRGEAIGGIDPDAGPGSKPDSAYANADVELPFDGPAGICCPIDQERSGCMHLGGTNNGASCGLTCDFFCSDNWRIEKDSNGCDNWHYDIRQPLPGEGPACNPLSIDASVDTSLDKSFACGPTFCDSVTQYCAEDVPGPPGATPTYACKAFPSNCTNSDACPCLHAAEDAACQTGGGAVTCTAQDGEVTFACAHP